MKRRICVFIILILIAGSLAVLVAARAKKPARVSFFECSRLDTQVVLSWKKAKRAKSYEVLLLKGKKYRCIKRVKTKDQLPEVTIKKLKPETKYKFRIRAVNGRKKGKTSGTITVKTLRKPITHEEITTDPSKFILGDIYYYDDGDGIYKIRVLELEKSSVSKHVYFTALILPSDCNVKNIDGGKYLIQ